MCAHTGRQYPPYAVSYAWCSAPLQGADYDAGDDDDDLWGGVGGRGRGASTVSDGRGSGVGAGGDSSTSGRFVSRFAKRVGRGSIFGRTSGGGGGDGGGDGDVLFCRVGSAAMFPWFPAQQVNGVCKLGFRWCVVLAGVVLVCGVGVWCWLVPHSYIALVNTHTHAPTPTCIHTLTRTRSVESFFARVANCGLRKPCALRISVHWVSMGMHTVVT